MNAILHVCSTFHSGKKKELYREELQTICSTRWNSSQRWAKSTTILQCIAMLHNRLGREGHVLLQLCPESRFFNQLPSAKKKKKSEEASRRNHILRGTRVITTSVLHIIWNGALPRTPRAHFKPHCFWSWEGGWQRHLLVIPRQWLPVIPTEMDNAKWNETKVSETVYKNGTFIATEQSCTWRHQITTKWET